MPKKMDPIRTREFENLLWNDPAQVLVNYRFIETELLTGVSDEKVRRLRTPGLKREREGRDAALFTYGFAQVVGTQVLVSNKEADDYDFVMRSDGRTEVIYYCVQLKELPPEDLNPRVSIGDLYKRIEMYGPDLNVAIRLNREMTIRWDELPSPKNLRIGSLWFFGSGRADQSKWFVYGNVLNGPKFHEFSYPTGTPSLSREQIEAMLRDNR